VSLTVAVVAVVLITLVQLAPYVRARDRLAAADHLARSVDLGLDPAVADVVVARLVRRERAGALGGLVVGLPVAWWASRTLGPDAAATGALLVFVGLFAGRAIGCALVSWVESARQGPAGARVARASTPVHGDYVARLERWGSWGMAAVAVVLGLGLLVLDRVGVVELDAVPVALVVLSVVAPPLAVILDELGARWLLSRPQVARSQVELAWDDALRARTLRDMVTVTIVVSAYAPLGLLAAMGDALEGGWPDNPAVGVLNTLLLVLLVGLTVMGLVSVAQRPQRHFRRTLWPVADAAPVGGAR
jgi:hypothetical protein